MATFPAAMVETAPQSLGELAHMVCLPQAARGQFHISFSKIKPSWFHLAMRALDSNLGLAGMDANAAVISISTAAVTASRVRARFSNRITFPLGCPAEGPRSDPRYRPTRYRSRGREPVRLRRKSVKMPRKADVRGRGRPLRAVYAV